MRWLIWRELTTAVRTSALWVGLCVHLVILIGFVLIWSDGVPVFGSQSVFEQFLFVQWVVLTVVLPWAAARCTTEDAPGLTVLSLLTASRPSHVVVAKCVGLTIALLAVVASSLPLAALALQISALPVSRLAQALPPLAAACGFVAVVTTTCMLASGSRLVGWLLASVATMVGLHAIAPGPLQAGALTTVALVVAIALSRRADVNWRYLP